MSAFLAQRSFKKLAGKLGQIGGEAEAPEDKDAAAEEEQERLEALREAEERRKEKHRKMEEEREKMRQSIRDKYGIKKREEEPDVSQPGPECSLNRKKKTPSEIAAEAEAEEQDDFSQFVSGWKSSIETQLGELKQTIENKCAIQ